MSETSPAWIAALYAIPAYATTAIAFIVGPMFPEFSHNGWAVTAVLAGCGLLPTIPPVVLGRHVARKWERMDNEEIDLYWKHVNEGIGR